MVTGSVEETLELGRKLGALLECGDVLALVGELGAGKTHLTKGVAAGLGLKDSLIVTSPTFVFLNTYSARIPVRHYDLYRAEGSELESFGFADFRDTSVSIVEWADKVEERFLGDHLRVEMKVSGPTRREIAFRPSGRRSNKILSELLNL